LYIFATFQRQIIGILTHKFGQKYFSLSEKCCYLQRQPGSAPAAAVICLGFGYRIGP